AHSNISHHVLLCSLTFNLALMLIFVNATATPAIYTLSLHDALPISCAPAFGLIATPYMPVRSSSQKASSLITCSAPWSVSWGCRDRKSTRLNSSHVKISYAVFCLKKKTTEVEYDYTPLPTSVNYLLT